LSGEPFRLAVTLIARYLSAAWAQPCYDWWEEHVEQVHVSTLTAVLAGLRSAGRSGLLSDSVGEDALLACKQIAAVLAEEGVVDGRLRKWLGSDAVDASLLAAVAPFDVIDDPVAARTVRAIEADLADDNGVHRFRADRFYGGGRWPVLAGLLGEVYVRQGRVDEARRQLEWMACTADADGVFPEQVSDRLLAPGHLDEWVQRWGPVARPLLWSHGEYLALSAQLGMRA
jgi:GH15 family glucan-1,4-alpha-glucosidase